MSKSLKSTVRTTCLPTRRVRLAFIPDEFTIHSLLKQIKTLKHAYISYPKRNRRQPAQARQMERGDSIRKHCKKTSLLQLKNQVKVPMWMQEKLVDNERPLRSQALEVARKKQHLRRNLQTKMSKMPEMERSPALRQGVRLHYQAEDRKMAKPIANQRPTSSHDWHAEEKSWFRQMRSLYARKVHPVTTCSLKAKFVLSLKINSSIHKFNYFTTFGRSISFQITCVNLNLRKPMSRYRIILWKLNWTPWNSFWSSWLLPFWFVAAVVCSLASTAAVAATDPKKLQSSIASTWRRQKKSKS